MSSTDRPLQLKVLPIQSGEKMLDWWLWRLTGTEALSQPFCLTLTLLLKVETVIPAESPLPSEEPFKHLLGHQAQVVFAPDSDPDKPQLLFWGIISRLTELNDGQYGPNNIWYRSYEADLAPRLWLLKRGLRSRIFQGVSVKAILETILKDQWGLSIDSTALKGETSWSRPREYCVQHAESDFAFVSRLMEEEGLCYHFDHSNSAAADVMVISDGKTAGRPDFSVLYNPASGALPDQVTAWDKTQELRSRQYTISDYFFENPPSAAPGAGSSATSLSKAVTDADKVHVGKTAHDLKPLIGLSRANEETLRVSDFGRIAHRYDSVNNTGGDSQVAKTLLETLKKDAEELAKVRLDEEKVRNLTLRGRSTQRQFRPGKTFTLEGHFNASEKDHNAYLVTSVTHTASQAHPESSSATGYFNTFQCIPQGLTYRPRRETPKPRIEGTQTALVLGMFETKDGVRKLKQEINTEKYGRVRVRFHWDTRNDGADSCWIRVAQPWAGNGFGALFIPRAGEEVVVAFLDGDPDHPVIVGSLYNSKNMPFVALPGEGAVSGFKSVQPDQEANNYHGLFFDDQAAKSVVLLRSQNDLNLYSQNNSFHAVGGNLYRMVGGSIFEKTGPSVKDLIASLGNALPLKVSSAFTSKASTATIEQLTKTPDMPWKNFIKPNVKTSVTGLEYSYDFGSTFKFACGGGLKVDANLATFSRSILGLPKPAIDAMLKKLGLANKLGAERFMRYSANAQKGISLISPTFGQWTLDLSGGVKMSFAPEVKLSREGGVEIKGYAPAQDTDSVAIKLANAARELLTTMACQAIYVAVVLAETYQAQLASSQKHDALKVFGIMTAINAAALACVAPLVIFEWRLGRDSTWKDFESDTVKGLANLEGPKRDMEAVGKAATATYKGLISCVNEVLKGLDQTLTNVLNYAKGISSENLADYSVSE